MDGIICINKPQEHTSFDVIARMRGILKIKHIGHSGTLDPMATGVLPVFVGKATKACAVLPDDDKTYKAGFQLGKTSNTYDIWGKITDKEYLGVSVDKVEKALDKFRGEIEQLPPMFSAVQVGGRRLYDIAREGIEVERPKRKVFVYELKLTEYDEKTGTGILMISCSKGTYIRSIINDFGELLGCGAVMNSLERTAACGFTLKDCITIEQAQEFNAQNTITEYIKPIESLFLHLPKIQLSEAQTRMFKNGVKLDLRRLQYDNSQKMQRVSSRSGEFLGLASLDFLNMELKIEKIFVDNN